ncbi:MULTISPECIES: hypothetical protein [unclassified Acidovorax]|uniref:hypothetical protein n=1 Tax=unclassified Acidovorax TaxID=2684926 RepID=UPI0012E1D27A|nr:MULTISPECIES: hypothetical protein [unclassified Acidovorax]
MKILFCIALCTFGACSTRSPQKFSTNKFSINFPENFHIESNNAGTIFAASKSTDSVIIVDYEDIENKENRNFCNNLREDFFSKITSNRESSELYGFFIKRDGYDLENKEIFASLAFYCKKGIALHISYIYKSPSRYTDELFSKLIHEVNFK